MNIPIKFLPKQPISNDKNIFTSMGVEQKRFNTFMYFFYRNLINNMKDNQDLDNLSFSDSTILEIFMNFKYLNMNEVIVFPVKGYSILIKNKSAILDPKFMERFLGVNKVAVLLVKMLIINSKNYGLDSERLKTLKRIDKIFEEGDIDTMNPKHVSELLEEIVKIKSL